MTEFRGREWDVGLHKWVQIRQLMNVVSLHLKVAILIMSSCGMRIGAFEYLNVVTFSLWK
jgi:hypothetical protein